MTMGPVLMEKLKEHCPEGSLISINTRKPSNPVEMKQMGIAKATVIWEVNNRCRGDHKYAVEIKRAQVLKRGGTTVSERKHRPKSF